LDIIFVYFYIDTAQHTSKVSNLVQRLNL